MYHNRAYSDVNEALPSLLYMLESEGEEIGSRAGRTLELTHIGITLENPCDREILLPARKANIAAQIAETMWVLAGRDDLEFLSHYLPRALDFSDDGETWRAGYGARLRRWEDHGHPQTIDQWRWLVGHLKEDRASRRAVMSIWDPVVDTAPGTDIPCNNWLSFLSRNGHLDLHVALRSNDVIWGWSGINQFEWSALLEITAGMVGALPGSLHFSTTSFHIYEHHWAKSAKIRDHAHPTSGLLRPSPQFDASVVDRDFDRLEDLMKSWFVIEEMIRNGYCPDGVVEAFTEPMLRSWLRVLQWWWSGDRGYLSALVGTRLEQATHYAVQPPERAKTSDLRISVVTEATRLITQNRSDVVREALKAVGSVRVADVKAEDLPRFRDLLRNPPKPSAFIEEVIRLHNEKDAAYGSSWKRRGEMLGIMANIARKVDRLGNGETADETSADTATDLLVYLAKYAAWLQDESSSDTTATANDVLRKVDLETQGVLRDQTATEEFLRKEFDTLEQAVTSQHHDVKVAVVSNMLHEAYRLARFLGEDDYRGADLD